MFRPLYWAIFRLRHGHPLPLAPHMPPILLHWRLPALVMPKSLRPLLTTPSWEPHACIGVLGHFPNTVDSVYCSTPTRYRSVSMPTWQPSFQRFCTDFIIYAANFKTLAIPHAMQLFYTEHLCEPHRTCTHTTMPMVYCCEICLTIVTA
jgi:hypothetical protein